MGNCGLMVDEVVGVWGVGGRLFVVAGKFERWVSGVIVIQMILG